jgi:hypothetical protein
VVKHIRRLGSKAGAVALDRLDDRLDSLFPELLGAFLWAARQQLCGPRGFGISPLAGGDGGGKLFQRHDSLIGMPAAAMWVLA